MKRTKTSDYWTCRLYEYTKNGKPSVDKVWYIEYYVRDPNTNKLLRKIFYGDINHETSVTARRKRAAQWARVINKNLREKTLPIFTGYSEITEIALRQAVDKKSEYASEQHAIMLRVAYDSLLEYLKHIAMHRASVNFIEPSHIRKYMVWLENRKKHVKPSTINSYLKNVRALFQHLVDHEVIHTNPATRVRGLPTKTTTSNVPLSPDEQTTVTDYLKEHDYPFYVFIALFYFSGLRPKQVLSLRIKDINLSDLTIIAEGETNKIRLQQVKAIPSHFAETIRGHIKGYKKEQYVFGSRPHLIPGDRPAKRDSVTKKWQRIVNKKLGIDKTLYSIRHKSAADMYYDGIDIKTISLFLGHRSIITTEKYLRSIVDFSLEKLKNRERRF